MRASAGTCLSAVYAVRGLLTKPLLVLDPWIRLERGLQFNRLGTMHLVDMTLMWSRTVDLRGHGAHA